MSPAGILDFEVALPDDRVTVEQLHRASGVSVAEILEITAAKEIPVLAPGQQAWELAVEAVRGVLARTGADPDLISRVLYVGNGYWDAPGWSPAAKVADEAGIARAHCFEVTNFCNALPLGLRIAVDGLRPGELALVVTGERFAGAVDRADPDSKGMFNFGDAAAAVLVGADRPAFGYLGSAARTDPGWSDYYVGEYHEAGVHSRRRGRRSGLADAYQENYLALVERTLADIDRPLADVRYLLVNQNDERIQRKLLDALGLPPERSVFQHADFGHLGCTDTLVALRRLLDTGALAAGDLVLLATSGLGFSWSVTALEYRGSS